MDRQYDAELRAASTALFSKERLSRTMFLDDDDDVDEQKSRGTNGSPRAAAPTRNGLPRRTAGVPSVHIVTAHSAFCAVSEPSMVKVKEDPVDADTGEDQIASSAKSLELVVFTFVLLCSTRSVGIDAESRVGEGGHDSAGSHLRR